MQPSSSPRRPERVHTATINVSRENQKLTRPKRVEFKKTIILTPPPPLRTLTTLSGFGFLSALIVSVPLSLRFNRSQATPAGPAGISVKHELRQARLVDAVCCSKVPARSPKNEKSKNRLYSSPDRSSLSKILQTLIFFCFLFFCFSDPTRVSRPLENNS